MPLGLLDVFTGTIPGDRTGTPGRNCFEIMNANSAMIEVAIEDAELKAFVVKCVAKDTIVEAQDSVEWWRQPYAFVLLEVRAACYASGSNDIVIDITENGSSILETDLLEIPAGSETSFGFSPQALPDPVILQNNSKIEIDIVEGAPSGAETGVTTGLEVTLIGYVIWTTY
jgi:hypothetical protein